ncbi:MAG: RNA polymerase sigma factor, partial [Actinomycetota bacterium]
TLIRIVGDIDLAEEAMQDAFVLATERWRDEGIPLNPGAWITTAARNKAIDRLRRERKRGDKEAVYEGLMSEPSPSSSEDDQLRLIFTCCHPSLAVNAQVALTLRTLGGLSTREIARAFLVPESTLAQRLVRVKKKIKAAGIPYRIPPDHLLPERLTAVLYVIYLVFNEGYSATEGPRLVRGELCDESIRLGRMLVQLMPDEPEAAGLLALMLFQDSRRDARSSEAGTLVLLHEQDRAAWDRNKIDEGARLLDVALRRKRPGPFQIQAAIAALHADAPTAADTDWHQIAKLYSELARHQPTPVVALNHAVAVAEGEGAAAGLALIESISAEGSLDTYHLLHSARAELLRRLGRHDEAAASYIRALELAQQPNERAFLADRLDEVLRISEDDRTSS